jgi:hypothetical protein
MAMHDLVKKAGSCALASALSLAFLGLSTAQASDDSDSTVTLIEMGDLHGTLVPHAAILKNPDGSEREVASSGGLARLKTIVNTIRADNPEAVMCIHRATGTLATARLYFVIVLQHSVRSHLFRATFAPCPVISVVMMYLLLPA